MFATQTTLDFDTLMQIADSSFASLGLYGHRYNDAMATSVEWALTAESYDEAEATIDSFASSVADSEEAEF